MLKKLRKRWQVWKENRPHPWQRVKRWATSPKGSPRRVLERWRTVQRWAMAKKDQATGAAKDVWRARGREARRRAKKKLKWLHEQENDNNLPSGPMQGTVMIDGRVVPEWMAPKINEIRARGRWKGGVVSGVRTPQYSEQLCYQMCGAPSCPGMCAGVNSNHNATPPVTFGEGAIDVSDYYVFAAEARAVGAPFKNDLPNDRVHFSRTGH